MNVPQVGSVASGAAGISAGLGSEVVPAAAVVRETHFYIIPLGRPAWDISLRGVV
jgi:hypothetical protein